MTDINVNVPDVIKILWLGIAGSIGFVIGFVSGVLFVVLGSS